MIEMIRRAAFLFPIAILGFFIGGSAQAACLPTLGTEACARAWDPTVQAIEHYYLDAPWHGYITPHARPARHRARAPRPSGPRD
jgi:hypothetical protein